MCLNSIKYLCMYNVHDLSIAKISRDMSYTSHVLRVLAVRGYWIIIKIFLCFH